MDEKAIKDISESLDEFARDWGNGLAFDNKEALRIYKDDGSALINKTILGDIKSIFALNLAKILDETLESAPALDRELVVFRGISPLDPITKVKTGKTSRYKTFLSSSISRAVGENFRDEYVDGVLIEIRVPKGYHGGAYIHSVPDVHYPEFEMLFRPGVKYKVIANEPTYIHIELIDEGRRKARLGSARRFK